MTKSTRSAPQSWEADLSRVDIDVYVERARVLRAAHSGLYLRQIAQSITSLWRRPRKITVAAAHKGFHMDGVNQHPTA